MTNPSPSHDESIVTQTGPSNSASNNQKLLLLAAIVVAFLMGVYLFKSYLNFDYLVEKEVQLKELYANQPALFMIIAFVLYVVAAGLSIPGGATLLTLVYAWFFGFVPALILVSFASTTGALVAFLTSRYILRDWIQNRFGKRIKAINEAFEKDGIFYLFLMRLIPAFPFYIVNLLMGVTQIKARTFWWVSQLGMLAGTSVFVYAGSIVPKLETIKEQGINAVFSKTQMLQIGIAFLLIGTFPIVVKKAVEWKKSKAQ